LTPFEFTFITACSEQLENVTMRTTRPETGLGHRGPLHGVTW
jgi:hypothetical protein